MEESKRLTRSFAKIHSLGEIALLPNLTINEKATAEVRYVFGGSGEVFEGVPLIISGTWSLEEAAKLAALRVLVEVPPEPFTADTDPTYLLPAVDEVDQLHAMMDRTVSPRQIVIYDCDVNIASQLREQYPNLTMFVGAFGSHHHLTEVGWDADVIVIPGESDDLEKNLGITTSHVGMMTDVPGPKSCSFDCYCPGDVVKCFALGARFVEINSCMRGHTVESIIGSIANACKLLGADNPHCLCTAATIALR